MKRKTTLFLALIMIIQTLLVCIPVSAKQNGSEVVTTEKHSGNASLFITHDGSGSYWQSREYIPVKKNTRYRYSAWIKTKRTTKNTFMSVDWGARLNTPTIGSTSDWSYYEMYWDSNDETEAEVQFTIDGYSEAVWIDDIEFIELDTEGRQVGVNLYPNPGFENGVSSSSQPSENKTIIGDEKIRRHEDLMKNEVISVADFDEVMSLEKHIPALYTENLTIDADEKKWENSARYLLPNSDRQYFTLNNGAYGGEDDLSAEFRFSYDYDNLYIFAKVKDDKHEIIDDANYWQQDCLQITVGQKTSSYGYELGFNYDVENNKINNYSGSVSGDKLKTIISAGKQENNVTTYELAIPWTVFFEGFEDRVPVMICVAVNDSDGNGRKQALQLTPGIIEGKSNLEFCVLDFLKMESNDWYAWNSGELTAYLNETAKFSTMIANRGEDKEFMLTTKNGETKSVTVKKNTIAKINWEAIPEEIGTYGLNAELEAGAEKVTIPLEVNVISKPRTAEEFEQTRQKMINEYIPELERLMDECKKKNIPVDYEMVNYATVKRFVQYAKEDMDLGQSAKANYVLDCLENLYAQAKSDLEGYLDGSKKYHVSQRYVTSKVEIDGTSVWADMRNSKTGEITRRPFIGTGYGHFTTARKDVPVFSEFGVSTMQSEMGPEHVFLYEGDVSGWSTLSNGLDCEYGQVEDEKKNGNASLKYTCKHSQKPNVFKYLYQTYDVKPNTTYKYGLSAKAKNNQLTWISVDGWNTPRRTFNGTYDWTDFEYEYTTGPAQRSMQFFLFFEGSADELYIDDVFVKELGDDENLLKNGDFESGLDMEYIEEIGAKYDSSKFYEIVNVLQRAEENNITYNVITSFHYVPEFLKNEDMKSGNNGHFMPWNIASEKLRRVSRIYMEKLLPLIKDYKSLNSICLLNEPGYCADDEMFLPYFIEFLRREYKNINSLNEIWQTNYKSFDEITFDVVKNGSTDDWISFSAKLEEQDKTPQFYDFIRFNDEITMDYFNYLAEIAEKIAPEIPVKYKTLTDYFGLDSNYNRQGIRRGVNLEMMDNVQYNGCDSHAYVDDLENTTILTKVRWYDYMTSIKNAPVYNSEDHVIRDSNFDYIPEQAIWWAANAWECAIHGGTMTVSWVWERSTDNEALMGSVLERPDVVANYGRISLDMNRLSYEFDAISKRDSHIAILDSEGARNESRSFINTSYKVWEAGVMEGHKVQYVTEKMAAEGKLKNYKILLVPEVNRLNEEALTAVEEYVNNGGKVFLLGEDCFKRNNYGYAYDENRIKAIHEKCTIVPIQVNGTKLVEPSGDTLKELIRNETEKLGLNKVTIIDNQTGKPAENVKWEYAEIDGNTVISVMNFDWNTTRNISIYVKGQKIEKFEEMREEKEYSDNYTLESYIPVMFKVNCTL